MPPVQNQAKQFESFELVTSLSKTRIAFNGATGSQGSLLGWSDEIQQRVNEHVILNRAGAIHQDRGTGPRKFTFRCLIPDPGAKDVYTAIEARLGLEPFCDMTHPRFGHMQVVYLGMRVTEEMDSTTSALAIEISVAETGLRDIPTLTPGAAAVAASAQTSQLTSALATLLAARSQAAQGLDVSQAVANVNALIALATPLLNAVSNLLGLVDGAVVPTTDSTGAVISVDPSVDQLTLAVALNQVGAAMSAFVALALADVANYPLVAAARLSYGYCLQAFATAASEQPPIVTHVVASRISLARLCAGLYGGGAQSLEDQISRLNRIVTPYALQVGQQLLIPDPVFVNLDSTPALNSRVVT